MFGKRLRIDMFAKRGTKGTRWYFVALTGVLRCCTGGATRVLNQYVDLSLFQEPVACILVLHYSARCYLV